MSHSRNLSFLFFFLFLFFSFLKHSFVAPVVILASLSPSFFLSFHDGRNEDVDNVKRRSEKTNHDRFLHDNCYWIADVRHLARFDFGAASSFNRMNRSDCVFKDRAEFAYVRFFSSSTSFRSFPSLSLTFEDRITFEFWTILRSTTRSDNFSISLIR